MNGALSAIDLESTYTVSDFVGLLFHVLDKCRVRYCVLHTWQGLPHVLPSDLDLAIHPDDRAKLPRVLSTMRDNGFLPVDCRYYEVNASSFFFYWFHGVDHRSVSVDIICEYRGAGMILIPGEKLVSRRRRFDSFWIPEPSVALQYLLAKKTLKGTFASHQQKQIKDLVEELGHLQAGQVSVELFGEKWRTRVVDACVNGTLPNISDELIVAMRQTILFRHPLNGIRYLFADSIRLIRRWFEPTGLFVVIMGPDGAGKSTLVAQLTERQWPEFRWHRVFHWRPQLIAPKPDTGPLPDPHGTPVRGSFLSVVRLIGFFMDQWVGYAFVIRPLLARSGLILFDRYFHDITIDNKRYRYGGPKWFARFLARLVPSPDLFLVLDAKEDLILSRKSEVEPRELKRLRSRYIQLLSEISDSVLIRTDTEVKQSAAAASRAIALYMTRRFKSRHGALLLYHEAEPQGPTAAPVSR